VTRFQQEGEPAASPEPEPSPPLPVWSGPGLPPPLVAHLYAPYRKKRGELYCLHCDEAIAVDPPPIVGFLKSDERESELCCFSICESCFLSTETREELMAMVAAAFDGTIAPDPVYN
jgi:hypothetical protein